MPSLNELEAMRLELNQLEALHESEITEEQQKRINELSNELDLYCILRGKNE